MKQFFYIFLVFFFVSTFTVFADYQNNSDYLSYKTTYTNVLTQKYSQIIASFSSSKKQSILENVNTLLAKYTTNLDETNKKTLQNIALLNAVKEALTTTQTVTQNNEKLLLGDGKASSSPKKGYVYSCSTSFHGGGAFRDGDWIEGDYWYPGKKNVTVDGSVAWRDAKISFTVVGNKRIVSGNALPTHTTGVYPVQTSDDAYSYDRNPNSIQQSNVYYTFDANPMLASAPSCLGMGPIGISITGVAIFNGLDDMGRDAVAHEIQDDCGGHPEMRGTYHYHNVSKCLEKSVSGTTDGSASLVGYARDGFGIFTQNENGKHLTNDDLDECHGHSHTILWDGKKVAMYHYHATDEYPYIVGCYKGTPVR